MTVYVCIEEEIQHSEIWDVHVAFVTFDKAKAKDWVSKNPSDTQRIYCTNRVYRVAELDWRNM